MLMQTGNAADALAAFEATMAKEPNRLNTILDAANAALASGNAAKAKQYFAAATMLASDSSVSRPQIGEARAFLAAAN